MTHWKDPDAGKDWRQQEKRLSEDEMAGWQCNSLSMMQWTWTWANSGRWWGTGRPGVLGSQRVGHNWAIAQQPRKLHEWKLYKYIQHQSSRTHTSKPWDIASHPLWWLEWKRQILASVDGEIPTLMHGWWEYKMVLPLWKTLCLSVS